MHLENSGLMQRLGRWIAGPRGKWITLLVWIVLTGLLSAMWPSVHSMKNNNVTNLHDNLPSVQADAVASREFPSTAGHPALIVWHREGGLTQEDLQHIGNLTLALDKNPLSGQKAVAPFYRMPAEALRSQASEDQSTIVMPLFFDENFDADQLKESVADLKKVIEQQFLMNPFDVDRDSSSEISARVTGPVGIQIDATALFSNADVSLMIATVLLVLVLLLLIYRSPILALIPLVAVGFAFGVVSPILGFMANKGWITADSQSISIMTVLLFGAGTDYCLFLIVRFRQLLTEERDKTKAIVRSLASASGAIAMSGFTVVLALLALLFAQYGVYYRFAVPFSLSILIMGAASLTLVPALLAIIGRTSFFPFVPRTPEMLKERAEKKRKPLPKFKETNRLGKRLGKLVVSKPWTIVIITVILLGGLASFSQKIDFTYDILSSFPETMPSREGFATIAEKFTPGELAPAKVMVDTKDIKGNLDALGGVLSGLPYAAKVSEPVQGKTNPQIVAYDLEFNMNPYSVEVMNHIPELRQAVVQELAAAGAEHPEEKVWISGLTATQYDTQQIDHRDTQLIIPIVILLIALLLIAYLRSIVATIYLVLTVILSYLSALGLGWLILHEVMGVEAIAGSIPLYSFVFLVALGEDYNIFMISSIWQKSKTMPLRQAITEGVGQTSSVITSAGLILAGTFAVLATLPIQVLVQFGLITSIGVLLDTFIVRPFLVPAITALLGKYAFWPGRLKAAPVTESSNS